FRCAYQIRPLFDEPKSQLMIVGCAVDADMAVVTSFVEAKDEQPGEPERDGGVLRHRHFPVLLMGDMDDVKNLLRTGRGRRSRCTPPNSMDCVNRGSHFLAYLFGLAATPERWTAHRSCDTCGKRSSAL